MTRYLHKMLNLTVALALIATTALPIPVIQQVRAEGIAITAFSFPALNSGDITNISGTDVEVTVPFGTDLTRLTPDIQHSGQLVMVQKDGQMVSGSGTEMDYSVGKIDYYLSGAGQVVRYEVMVNAALNPAKDLTKFNFELNAENQAAGLTEKLNGILDEDAKTVTVSVAPGITRSALLPTLEHSGASYSPTGTVDFTNPVTFTITAEDGTSENYTVNVNEVDFHTIAAFNFPVLNGTDVAEITDTEVNVTVPFGTDISDLAAHLELVTGSTAYIEQNGAMVDAEGAIVDFTNGSIDYYVSGGGKVKRYVVSVIVAANPAKSITSFKFEAANNAAAGISNDVEGIVNHDDQTITFNLADTINLSSLLPTVTYTGASITPLVGARSFAQGVTYTITAADSSTITYNVIVNSLPATDITSFTFQGFGENQSTTINGTDVLVKIPYNSNKTNLVANIEVVAGSEIYVQKDGAMIPASGEAMDFSAGKVDYYVSGGGAVKRYEVEVAFLNNPPVLTDDIENISEDLAYVFTEADFTDNYSDPEGDSITGIQIMSLPEISKGVLKYYGDPVYVGDVIDNLNFTGLAFLGRHDANGQASFQWRASDGELYSNTATKIMQISEVNDAPVLKNAQFDQSVLEESQFSYTMPANTFEDVDSVNLTYTATKSDGTALPAWLSFNPLTREFSGVPQNADVNEHLGGMLVKVTAVDEGFLTAEDEFLITVMNKNDGPRVVKNIPDQIVYEDQFYSYTVDAGTFEDIDPVDTLNYSAVLSDGTALPAWLSFNPATRTFSGTPANEDVGNKNIRVKVIVNDNAGETSFDEFMLIVLNVNDAPVANGTIPNQTTLQETLYKYTLASDLFVDPDPVEDEVDNDFLILSATLQDGSSLPAWLDFDKATQTFIGTPRNADVGIINITVNATDKHGATSGNINFSLEVINTNDRPFVQNPIDDQKVLEDSQFTFQVPANTFYDLDLDLAGVNESLTYSASIANAGAIPAWLSFDPNTQTFSGVPSNDDVGETTIRVTVTDKAGETAYDDFILTVENRNNGPRVINNIPDQTIFEDAYYAYTIPTNVFEDVDAGDVLTYSATMANGSALPTWLSFNPNTRELTGTPLNEHVGNNNIEIRIIVNDSQNETSYDTFMLNVLNTADAPYLNSQIPDLFATQGQSFSYALASDTFLDVDSGDMLTYKANLVDGSNLPAWLSFTADNQIFSGTPGNSDVGTLNIRVTATDRDNLEVTDEFVLTVNNVNDAPTYNGLLENQVVVQGELLNYSFAANTFTDIDAGDALNYTVNLHPNGLNLPAWLSFNAATRTFSGTPGNSDLGTFSVQVTATDASGLSANGVFSIEVRNKNDAPTVKNALIDQRVNARSKWLFEIPENTFEDIDGDTLVFSASQQDGSSLPAWLSFNTDPANLVFEGTPGDADTGNLLLRVTASDPFGERANADFTLTILDSNGKIAVVNPIVSKTINEDELFNFQVPANTFESPVGGETYVYNAVLSDGTALPAWLSFDSATRTFSGTPLNEHVGNNNIEVRIYASNNIASTGFDQFMINVLNVNDTPTVKNPIADMNAPKNRQFTFQIPANTFEDVDTLVEPLEKLTYTVSLSDGSALPAWLSFDSFTNTFTGTPRDSDLGNVNVKVEVTDMASASVSDEFIITVLTVANNAPSIANPIADMSVSVGVAFNYQVPANTFSDQDAGDILTLSAAQADGTALPGWLSFSAINSTFTGTPNLGDAGTKTIRVTATDIDGLSVSDDFSLTVDPGNTSPTDINLSVTSILENSGNGTVVGNFTASDPNPGDTFVFLIVSQDVNAFSISGSQLLVADSTLLDFETRNSINIRVRATDSAANTLEKDFVITITDVSDSAAPVVVASAGSNGAKSVFSMPITESDEELFMYNPVMLDRTDGKITRPLTLKNGTARHYVEFERGTKVTICESGLAYERRLSYPSTIPLTSLDIPVKKGQKVLRIVDFATDNICFNPGAKLTARFYFQKRVNPENISLYHYDIESQKLTKMSSKVDSKFRDITAKVNNGGYYAVIYTPGAGDENALTFFKDIENHWVNEYVAEIVSQNIIDEAEYFYPDRKANRAQIAKMSVEAFNLVRKSQIATSSYPDVDPSSWYAPHVERLTELGLAWGYDDEKFYPEKNILKVEALKLILLSAGIVNPQGESDYEDVDSNEWYSRYVGYAYENGIISKNKYFYPASAITRAEAIAMIVRTQRHVLDTYKDAAISSLKTTANTKTAEVGESLTFDVQVKKYSGQDLKVYGIPVWCQVSLDNEIWLEYGKIAYTNENGLAKCEAEVNAEAALYFRGMRRGVSNDNLNSVRLNWSK